MDRIKQQFEQLQTQLAGLTPSQKMLVGTLVAIMVVTVVWWTRFAASGEYVALLDQPMTAEQVGQIRQVLSQHSIDARVAGDAVLVKSAERDEAMSLLSYNRALPADTTQHFDKALGNMGSFDSRQKLDLTILVARQNALAADIRRWQGVRSVSVHVNPTYKRQAMGDDILPSATVIITTSGGVDSKQLAQSAAFSVAGAFGKLEPGNVEVTIDGKRSKAVSDELLSGTAEHLALRARSQRMFEDMVRNAIGYVDNMYVSVAVDLDSSVTKTLKQEFDPDSKVIAPRSTRVTRDGSEESTAAINDDPGFGSNTSVSALDAPKTPVSRNDVESEETDNVVGIGSETTEKYDRFGNATPVSCIVSLPRSFVLLDWRSYNGVDATADPAELREYERELCQRLSLDVQNALGLFSADAVKVSTYADAGGGEFVNATLATATGGTDEIDGTSVTGLISDYGKTAAVVGLAGAALFLVSSTMKKGGALAAGPATSSTPINDLSELDPELANLLRGEQAQSTWEASGVDPTLIAQEVADDQLQASVMVEQVQELVKENPEAAAQLVKRWLNAG